ncbi:MAG: hypothetical protein KAX10_03440 [Candidatus Lokiarchaeota archaeon]|nr:hypothetical protein [Candidatus Lokiarchaeota archaeon]
MKNIYYNLKRVIFNKEIYVKGKEPPKSYFGKKFWGLFGIFLFFSFMIFFNINNPDNIFFQSVMFGDPFIFGNALIFFYFSLSILFSVDKIRQFIFEKNTAIKQIVIFSGLITGWFFLFSLVDTLFQFNYMSFLLILAMIWLILQSSRFYTYSRKFSTKIEAKVVSKYSIFRNFIIFLIPFLILGFLVIISWFFRAFIVFLTLDLLGTLNPIGSTEVYLIEMKRVMPLIYISLITTIVFIIIEFILTRKRAETRRAGLFDNFTFAIIVFFIFFYQIYQVTLYTILLPETSDALKGAFGGASNIIGYLFIFEFLISMIFLIRIIRKIGTTLGWRILFFKKDGLIMFFLACVLGQTISRFAVATSTPNQEIGGFSELLMHDRFLISIIMIIFLGLTILVYYLKPHETSMFMRIQKEIVKEEEKSMETILKILRNEFIRRGEAFPIDLIEKELIKASQLSKGIVYSIIRKIDDKKVDFRVLTRQEKEGPERKYAEFTSITEKFQKKGEAAKKARHYLSEQLVETLQKQPGDAMQLQKKIDKEKASDKFIQSLSTNFSKKVISEQKHTESIKEKTVSFTKEHDEFLEDRIIKLIKKEYIYRIENPEQYPEYKFLISEIAPIIELETKVSSGVLYPLLEELNKSNLELNLLDNKENPDDKFINFIPHWDFDIDNYLINFHPEDYSKTVIYYYKKLASCLTQSKYLDILKSISKKIKNENELQESLNSFYDKLIKYYPKFEKELKRVPDKEKLIKLLEKYATIIEEIRSKTKN